MIENLTTAAISIALTYFGMGLGATLLSADTKAIRLLTWWQRLVGLIHDAVTWPWWIKSAMTAFDEIDAHNSRLVAERDLLVDRVSNAEKRLNLTTAHIKALEVQLQRTIGPETTEAERWIINERITGVRLAHEAIKGLSAK